MNVTTRGEERRHEAAPSWHSRNDLSRVSAARGADSTRAAKAPADQPDAGTVPTDRVTLSPHASELTDEQLQLVNELSARDRDVRAHEAAHQAAGGALAGGATFSYQQGPDGKAYAIGGEVSISFGAGSSPADTIAQARQVRAAALAPADPSSQDLRVAAAASALELKASLQLSQVQAQTRGNHVHAQEPCGTCAKVTNSYISD